MPESREPIYRAAEYAAGMRGRAGRILGRVALTVGALFIFVLLSTPRFW